MHWEKELTKTLMDNGFSWEHARLAIGVIAEQRQIADQQGYIRGFNNGWDECKKKIFRG
jgi:hypothetical protein